MTEGVKKRKYDASRRRAAAEQTKAAVLRAARELFTTRGYAATPVADIARAAGVSVDTLYETVGRKPQLLLAVHDMELAGGDAPAETEQRRLRPADPGRPDRRREDHHLRRGAGPAASPDGAPAGLAAGSR